jgi:hypothetical protein
VNRLGPGSRFPAAEGIDLVNRLVADLGDGNGVATYSPRIRMTHPSKIPPWDRWAVRRFHSYACGDGGQIAKNDQPHILCWGARTVVAPALQMLSMRGWRSLAFGSSAGRVVQRILYWLVCFPLGRPEVRPR